MAETPHSPYSFLHALLHQNPHNPHHLLQQHDDDNVLGDRHRRFVVTHSMIEESRFNIALLVLFILCIFVINAFFIAIILLSKRLRSSSKHILILSVASGDLLQGLLILPMITDIGNKSTEFDCNTFQVARLLADFLIPSITTLGVLALNIDYVLRLSCNPYAEGNSRACILGTLFLTPWVLSVVLLVPIYVVGVQRVSVYNVFSACSIIMEGGFARALLVLSYILYGCVLLAFTLAVAVMYLVKREYLGLDVRGERVHAPFDICLASFILVLFPPQQVAVMYLIKREYLGLDVRGERVHAPFDICLASFILVLFYTPIFLFTLLTTEGYLGCVAPGECHALNWSYTLSLWLMFTKSWVLPTAWFFGRDTRAGIKEVLHCC